MTFSSRLPVLANICPVGSNVTANAISSWPLKVCMHTPLLESHNRIVLSADGDASTRPSGDHAMRPTLLVCPRRVRINFTPGGSWPLPGLTLFFTVGLFKLYSGSGSACPLENYSDCLIQSPSIVIAKVVCSGSRSLDWFDTPGRDFQKPQSRGRNDRSQVPAESSINPKTVRSTLAALWISERHSNLADQALRPPPIRWQI